MTFCHNCGHELTLGNENFCPRCGTNLQQKRSTVGINNQSIGVQQTTGDVLGTAVSGSGNIIAKDMLCCMINYVVGGTHLTTRHLACE